MGKRDKPPWHLARPADLVAVTASARAEQPLLHNSEQDGLIWFAGSFDLRDQGVLWERFQIRLCLPADYPTGIPMVWETGGRIPRLADRHVLSNGALCLFAPEDREWVWPTGAGFDAFLRGPLRDYFIGQTYFEQHGSWPFGDRSHGADRLLEVFRERIGVSDLVQLEQYLFVISRTTFCGHLRCPCGSGKRLRDCHADQLLDLHRRLPRPQAQQMWKWLRNARQASRATPSLPKTRPSIRRLGARKTMRMRAASHPST